MPLNLTNTVQSNVENILLIIIVIITDLLESEGLELPDVCSVNIYMRDMEEYAELNAVYVDKFSFPNPPTRVCVQCPLPKNVGLIMDAVSNFFFACVSIK